MDMDLERHREHSREKPFSVKMLCGISLWFVLAGCSNALDGNHIGGNHEIAVAPKTAPGAMNPAPILLFNGTGTSRNDVAAIETILSSSHLSYSTANSFQLNRMAEAQISGYRLLIVPGGNFVAMGASLTAGTIVNVRNAVKGGLSYLGICAGGFLAGSFPAPYNSFDLSSGVKFGFYAAGTRKAAVRITTAEGPALDQYWEEGPQFTGWGEIVGKYPDGTPAVVERSVGRGWVILSGVHPEAPESWRRGMTFATSANASTAYAMTLIDAALNRKVLMHY
jgi:glutamine amidotransferase-like uncharacterized protein